ncbi:ferredoxin [Streptomyces sp. NPDC058867]|uniref:ferredoxin n=1 Tax=unclassified Streptomyces TaxID=2593676 RepID=UPI0036A6099A
MTFTDRTSGAGKLDVERDRCVGAGQCVLAAPAVFDQDDQDGLVVVLDRTPQATEADAVRDAVRACPSGAITLR